MYFLSGLLARGFLLKRNALLRSLSYGQCKPPVIRASPARYNASTSMTVMITNLLVTIWLKAGSVRLLPNFRSEEDPNRLG